MSRPLLVLVGPPGAGKTTVGRALSQRLQVAFRDTDADVEALAGKPIPDIFFEDGEAAFRAVERRAVADAVKEHHGILSLGGGAVLAADSRELLRRQRVAFLDVTLSEASRRVGLSAPRPVLGMNPRAQLQQLLAERRPLYLEVATQVVATSGRAVADIVDELAATVQM